MNGIKVTYIVDGSSMGDSDFEDQTEQEFIIDEKTLRDLVERVVPTKQGLHIDWSNSWMDEI